jgi:hypothetical protein
VRHKELNGASLCIAYEAAVSISVPRLGDARWAHDEVSVVLIIVKRADTCEVHACLAECYEVAHDILNLRAVNDSLYYFVWNLWHNIVF